MSEKKVNKVNGFCDAHFLCHDSYSCNIFSFYLQEPNNPIAKRMAEEKGIRNRLDQYINTNHKQELVYQFSSWIELPRCQEQACNHFHSHTAPTYIRIGGEGWYLNGKRRK
jgi:hypothetical protein